jgi:thymidylate synthase (FAD)
MSYKEYIGSSGGFVERLEVFGSDLTVVNAARVSFAKESHAFSKQDAKLVQYLARHNHTSPFFHPQIRFRLKMPIFVAREWFRHTVGFSRNEVSRRYVDFTPELWQPCAHEIRARDPRAKQGSKDCAVDNADDAFRIMHTSQQQSLKAYNELLAAGVAPEVARAVLPQSMMTEFIETASLAAYARLCKLRLDPHAQKEIRDYAAVVERALYNHFPVSWTALMEDTVPAVSATPAPVPAPTPSPTPPVEAMANMTIDNSLTYTQWGC